MDIVLTFWLCAFGTICAPTEASYWKGQHTFTMILKGTSIIDCDAVDAITDDKYIDEFLINKLVFRHTCQINGGDDL